MKPRIPQEFFINDELGALSPLHRLLFLGLIALSSDSAGVIEDRPKRLRAQILPYDADVDADAMLDDIENVGFITRESANQSDAADLIVIHNFSMWDFEDADPND